jgi:hypothetical protein
MVEGVGWAGPTLNFEPSPQIELGGSLTSGGSLTRRQQCNHNSIRIDPVMEIQA